MMRRNPVNWSWLEYFPELNGFELTADDPQCVPVILSIASDAFSEDALAEWVRKNAKPL